MTPRLPEATWRFWHDAGAVAALVDKGAATAAILCSPVSVAQTRAAAVDRAAHAAEDDLLHPEATLGNGLPQVRRAGRPSSDLTYETVQVGAERSNAERSPGPLRSAAATS